MAARTRFDSPVQLQPLPLMFVAVKPLGNARLISTEGRPERLLELIAAGHPIAIALRRQDNVDDARVTKNETLVRRVKKWFRYDAPDEQLFKKLQKTLTD